MNADSRPIASCLDETVDDVEELDEEVDAQLGQVGGEDEHAHLGLNILPDAPQAGL